ncbi:hypothetical protein TNCV_914761 [Trichonephila clavipes]|uniref:Uncharacterized protein n=1 Tax=Trichonephila clavipes TaxID=2585209 RepID=A0A8X6UUB7_TRICX|nr:hypothetical protein TNCV_914761 [Trichonephila clavipes]
MRTFPAFTVRSSSTKEERLYFFPLLSTGAVWFGTQQSIRHDTEAGLAFYPDGHWRRNFYALSYLKILCRGQRDDNICNAQMSPQSMQDAS